MNHLNNIERHFGSLKNKNILDIGSGSGDFLIQCAKMGYNAIGLELADYKIKSAHEKARANKVIINIRQGVAEKIPLASNAFDFINASELIEHVNNPEMVLAEVSRLLKPGGYAYMSVHNRFGLYDSHFHIYCLSWMPRSWAEKYLSLINKHKTYHGRNGCQRISEMHYYTFSQFQRLAKKYGLLVNDLREKKVNRWLMPLYRYFIRPAYLTTFHLILTKPRLFASPK